MTKLLKINKEIISFMTSSSASDTEQLSKWEKYMYKNDLLDLYKTKVEDSAHLKDIEYKQSEIAKIISLFDKIELETGIPYFAMKSFLTFPFFDHDIDFVITKSGYKTYKNALIDNGFKIKYDLSNLREPLKMLFSNENYYITPHLHSEISWNGIIAASKDEFYEESVLKEYSDFKIKIPTNTDEVIIAICHFLFENYYIKLGEIIYLRDLLSGVIDYDKVEMVANDFGFRSGVDLYFSYLSAISKQLDLDININLKYVKPVVVDINKPFPYYIPYKKLMPVYKDNFINGVHKKQYINLFRKLFTYTLVGYLWKYWLPIKRQKKFLLQFLD